MTTKSRFTTWLRRRLVEGSKSKSDKQSPDQPPCFLSPRPHTLTPKPSRESLTNNCLQAQPLSCPLFAKLSADIRREILLLAFGKRTLHMDLAFDHPVISLPPEDQAEAASRTRGKNHAALNTQQLGYCSPGLPVQMHHDKPKVWRWGGTVCHRNVPLESDSVLAWMYQWKGPWNDYCQLGNAEYCHLYEGQWPDKCTIGIMGFLLSCRQAYVEGIEILYGANCISMASEPLMLYLPKLILPQRLASITTLELSIKAHVESPRPGEFNVDFSHLAPILNTLAAHCPGLRSVHLSLRCDVYASPCRLPVSSTLRTVDAFFCSMWSSSLRRMTLELPKTTWRACRETAARPPTQHELEENQLCFAWRCFDRKEGKEGQVVKVNREPETQMRSAGNYPKPPLQLPTPENKGKYVPSTGYWIVEGNDDRPELTIGCFGSAGLG